MSYDNYLDSQAQKQVEGNEAFYKYLEDFLYTKYDDLYEFLDLDHEKFVEVLKLEGVQGLIACKEADEVIEKFCDNNEYGLFIYEIDY